jgi:arsenate reductase (thioredoxin)
MTERTYNVLFLCTGNSARSILAEGILRKDGAERFKAHSAGSQPKGTVNPLALKVLGAHGYPTDGYRSKSWDEFAAPGAPVMDFVLTVCDSAAGEACPVWLGHPSIAHWGIDDPAAVEGSAADREQAFARAFQFLKSRIGTFIRLPLASLDQFTIGTRIRAIGQREGTSMIPAVGTGPHLA